MDFLDDTILGPISDFATNSRMLVRKCQKPNYAEYHASTLSTIVGFAILGFLGFFVKLIFIPINNVILGV